MSEQPDDGSRRGDAAQEHHDDDVERAEELADETAERNPDAQTAREAIEQELASEGLSDEGEHIGQHIE